MATDWLDCEVCGERVPRLVTYQPRDPSSWANWSIVRMCPDCAAAEDDAAHAEGQE